MRLAFDSLRASVLRSALTLLGIILSTMTLIAVMGVIRGMDVYIANSASTMGNDGFRVVRVIFVSGIMDAKKFYEAQQRNPLLTREEFNFIQPRLTHVRESGISGTRLVNVTAEMDAVSGVALQGNTANAAEMSNTQIATGRFLTETENDRKMAVAFMGADLKERFFPGQDALGKMIAIDGRPFEVIGIGQPKGSLFGQSQDNYVSIPAETYFKIYGDRGGVGYNFQAQTRDQLEQAQDEVRVAMRAYRHMRPGQEDTFSVVSSDSLVALWDQLTGAIAAVAVAVVSVFMVVGGVVVMNIMLAVVSERTREIGVRKSLGARRSDIMSQFLIESAMLSGAGGLIGVILATATAFMVRTFTPVPMEVPLYAVVTGLTLSTAVGVFFGIYPARQAARLDPIVALRSES